MSGVRPHSTVRHSLGGELLQAAVERGVLAAHRGELRAQSRRLLLRRGRAPLRRVALRHSQPLQSVTSRQSLVKVKIKYINIQLTIIVELGTFTTVHMSYSEIQIIASRVGLGFLVYYL